jgi:hypothetical protein
MTGSAILQEQILPAGKIRRAGRFHDVRDQRTYLLIGQDLTPHRHVLVGTTSGDRLHCNFE